MRNAIPSSVCYHAQYAAIFFLSSSTIFKLDLHSYIYTLKKMLGLSKLFGIQIHSSDILGREILRTEIFPVTKIDIIKNIWKSRFPGNSIRWECQLIIRSRFAEYKYRLGTRKTNLVLKRLTTTYTNHRTYLIVIYLVFVNAWNVQKNTRTSHIYRKSFHPLVDG